MSAEPLATSTTDAELAEATGSAVTERRQPTSVPEVATEDSIRDATASQLPPIQRAGIELARTVFAAIFLASLGIAWISLPFPVAPAPPTSLSSESLTQYTQLVEVYKQLNDIALQRLTQLFQVVVITALLPSFTAILGYIFGSQKNG